MPEYQNHDFGEVGRCIYCGSNDDLTTEHIIPYGLGGKSILKKASCKKCAAITSQIEKEVLRNTFFDFRNSMNFPTRNKKNRSEEMIVIIEHQKGESTELSIPPQESPALFIMVEFELPGIFIGREDNTLKAVACSLHGTNERIKEFKEKYSAESITCKGEFNHSFVRLLAKIAYGYTVGMFGIDNLERNYVVKFILNRHEEGIAKFVGTVEDKILDGRGVDHKITFRFNQIGEILVRIKLFAPFDTPEYLVVVGKLTEPAFKNVKKT